MRKKMSLLALSMAVLFFISACSSGSKNATDDVAKEIAGSKPTDLTVAYYVFGEIPKEQQLVEDEINKLTLPKINVKVKLMPIPLGSWNQQVNLMLSSGEKLDLLTLQSSLFSGHVAKGQIIAFDDLLEKDGQGIKQAMAPEFLKAGSVNGKLYGIPSVRDLASGTGLLIRKDYIEKYKIDTSKVKTLDDVESMILKPIKEQEPNLVPLVPHNATNSHVYMMSENDVLGGDDFGVLPDRGKDLKVVNWFETPKYAGMLKKMRSWYNAGYIMKDAPTNKESVNSLIKADKGIAFFSPTKPGIENQTSTAVGYPMVSIELIKPFTTTSKLQTLQWGIAANSKVPDKAMQFLNLMYTDKDIINLLDWGIEGKHYIKTADGHIDFPQGVDAKSSGYNLNLGWIFGNQFLSHIWAGDSLDLWKQIDDFNKTAEKSKALGFTFDGSNVKTEKAALTSVTDQYKLALEYGLLDSEKALPEFISKLKAAGIDKYIAEKQKQLDEWAKTNK